MLMRKIVLPLLVVLGFCALFWLVAGNLFPGDARESLPPESAPTREAGVVPVTVAPVTFRPIQRSVVAVGRLRERQVVIGRLRLRGAHVIEANHQRLGPALVERYLELKREDLL